MITIRYRRNSSQVPNDKKFNEVRKYEFQNLILKFILSIVFLLFSLIVYLLWKFVVLCEAYVIDYHWLEHYIIMNYYNSSYYYYHYYNE